METWSCFVSQGARQMGRCVSRYYGNLQWFTYNHPPMVLFTLSILCFALILTLLTFYVSTKAKINKVDSSQVQEIHRFLCHYFYFFYLNYYYYAFIISHYYFYYYYHHYYSPC